MGLKQNVANGSALLDIARPNWYNEIDLERLDLTMPVDCILGQLYGIYSDGIDDLHLTTNDRYSAVGGTSARFGFTMPNYEPHEDWERLTNLWRKEIKRKRREHKAIRRALGHHAKYGVGQV